MILVKFRQCFFLEMMASTDDKASVLRVGLDWEPGPVLAWMVPDLRPKKSYRVVPQFVS